MIRTIVFSVLLVALLVAAASVIYRTVSAARREGHAK